MEALVRFGNIPLVESSVKTAEHVYFELKVSNAHSISNTIHITECHFDLLETQWLVMLESGYGRKCTHLSCRFGATSCENN